MKKMLAVLAAVLFSAEMASAQTASAAATRPNQGHLQEATRPPKQRAEMQTKRLTQQLGFSADQSAKGQALALTEHQELQALRSSYATANHHQGAGQERKAVQERYDAQLQSIFMAEQYARYVQRRNDRADKRKVKMERGRLNHKSQA